MNCEFIHSPRFRIYKFSLVIGRVLCFILFCFCFLVADGILFLLPVLTIQSYTWSLFHMSQNRIKQ